MSLFSRYCKLGTSGKAVPGVKVKVLPTERDLPNLLLGDDDSDDKGEVLYILNIYSETNI